MAQTTAFALKVLIESLGLGLTAYGDRPSQSTPRPYVTIDEENPLTPDPLEDGGPSTAVETVLVDLWQDWRDIDGTVTGVKNKLLENYTLAPALKRGLHGARTQLIGSAVVYMVLLRHSVRLLEPDANKIHHALTLDVFRQI